MAKLTLSSAVRLTHCPDPVCSHQCHVVRRQQCVRSQASGNPVCSAKLAAPCVRALSNPGLLIVPRAVQAKGLLQEGQVLGNAALPPFEKWSMTAPRYLQYLSNLLHVHTALERAAAAALAEGLASHNGGVLLLLCSRQL